MKKSIIILLFISIFLGCQKDDNETVDKEKPTVSISSSTTFPVNCSEVKRGESFEYNVVFNDNVELGSYNIDIHHNFDHHSHSTEVNECNLGEKKDAIKPFTYIKTFSIPQGKTSYNATGTIEIPTDIDTGNYHFMYKVTDQSGWQGVMGLSIKIVD